MTGGVAERLAGVRSRIDAACGRVGREPSEIGIVAVGKTFGPAEVAGAAGCGLTIIGENRVQEARGKIPLCPGNLEWHMIGHLQRNKVRLAVRLFEMIHSVDSEQLLEAVDSECGVAGKVMPVLLEVNVSGEGSKFGLKVADVPELLVRSRTLMNVDIEGLMTMPPFTADAEGARPFFRKLRELRDEWRELSGVLLESLSMGMSRDFEIAIEEGATWIRLGSVLFGSRKRVIAPGASAASPQ